MNRLPDSRPYDNIPVDGPDFEFLEKLSQELKASGYPVRFIYDPAPVRNKKVPSAPPTKVTLLATEPAFCEHVLHELAKDRKKRAKTAVKCETALSDEPQAA